MHHTVARPIREHAGYIVLTGNLFDEAVLKTSVISADFEARYLSTPGSEGVLEGRAAVFEGPEDYHARINDPALNIGEDSILVIRNCGPVGYPGSAEVVNMQPPDALIRRGILELPCIGDGRQSGTSGSPSILNASPESAVGGGLALLQTGDRIRIDIPARRADMLVDESELEKRREDWVATYPEDQTPWQQIYRGMVGQLNTGGCLEPATAFLDIVRTKTGLRHSH